MDPYSSHKVWIVEDNVLQKLQGERIRSALECAGFDVDQYRPDDRGFAARPTSDQAPLLIVHSVYFAHRLAEHHTLASDIRERHPGVHQTVVGHLPALIYDDLLNSCRALDSVICGDPEAIVPVLAEHLRRDTGWATIPGVAIRAGHGGAALTMPNAIRLDQIIPPTCDRVPATCAAYAFTGIEASRGCYHACSFCLPSHAYRRLRLPYRLRSIPNLLQEMQAYYDLGVRLFLFDDDQFLPPGNLRYQRVSQLASGLADQRMEIAFTIKCRPDDIDVALFRHLKQMGLIRVYAGIESGCQPVLDAFDKRVTVQQNLTALALLNELGMIVDFRSLLFHPLTTLETLKADTAFLDQAIAHVSTLFDLREVEVFPGTAFARYVSEPSELWPMPTGYKISDQRAELVRRCCRIVFGTPGPVPTARERITQLWFEFLLKERFHPETMGVEYAAAIRGVVRKMNNEMLSVMRQMLDAVSADPIPTAKKINLLVGDWLLNLRKAAQDWPDVPILESGVADYGGLD